MPTRAAPPPPARLNNRGDHCCSSPTRRSTVTARVMIAGRAWWDQTCQAWAPPSERPERGRGDGREYSLAFRAPLWSGQPQMGRRATHDRDARAKLPPADTNLTILRIRPLDSHVDVQLNSSRLVSRLT